MEKSGRLAQEELQWKRYLHFSELSLPNIYLPMNVTISRLRMVVMSSGTSQMVAPIFLAMEMASLAFWYFSSSVLPGATSS
ncbi:hypothetical protein KC330_g34 [Hortaea werneckii]|nr:hypothetical protein KC330_g34 [Hortaea werneckii]